MRVETQCAGCGALDDHPKSHTATSTKHHDCLSPAEREMVVASSPQAAAIIEACENGLRGPDLLAFIIGNQEG